MTTEAEVVPETAVAVRQPTELPITLPTAPAPTALQQRVIEVSEALSPAYQRASTLEMTGEEAAELTARFPDDAVEIRPHDGLIYLPHILISDRLTGVFGPGKWALVCRRHWIEGITMFGEYVLLIRGCFVGESVGGHPYQPNNPKVNYSDTLESTAAEALRRIAGKRLSCGSQVWHPEYARQWVAKFAYQQHGKWAKRPTVQEPPGRVESPAVPQHAPPPTKASPAPAPQAPPPLPTEQGRAKMISQLLAGPDGANRGMVTEYFRKLENPSALMPNEELEDLSLEFVPATQKQFEALKEAINSFSAGAEIVRPFPPHILPVPTRPRKTVPTGSLAVAGALSAPPRPHSTSEPDAVPFDSAAAKAAPTVPRDADPDRWFLEIIVPVPRKGQKRDEYLKHPDTIGSLYEARHGDDEEAQIARTRLWGFCEKYEAKGWTKHDGTKMPPSDTDIRFREALDAFRDWFASEHPDEKL